MSTVRIVEGTTALGGNRVLRAVDAHDIAAASAILVDGRWVVSGYGTRTPVGSLETRYESDAREWVQWIGEQMAAL